MVEWRTLKMKMSANVSQHRLSSAMLHSPSAGQHGAARSRSSLHRLRPTSRDFVPWRFLDAGQLSVRSVSLLPASKNQHRSGRFARHSTFGHDTGVALLSA
jgi:hypothetical protein